MWTHKNIQRLIIDFSLKSSNQSFNGDHHIYQNIHADLKNDIGLDSIEMMQLAAYVNNFFNLFNLKDSPYLLSYTKLSDWVNLIYEAKRRENETLKFHSSGTSGNTKIIEHDIKFIKREISFLTKLFNDSSQIITYIPSYTIYGFLFTIGLPECLHIPVIYPSEVNWKELSPRTLIVATPFQWQLLANCLPNQLLGIQGVTAAAPMHQFLYDQILSKDIELSEIYGATETAGVGFRNKWQNPFTLFPYWQLNEQNGIIELEDKDNHRLYPLMDDIVLASEQTFSVVGRKDQQIKIAGHLVHLEKVEKAIQSLSNIKDCTLSAKADNNEIVIQASLRLILDNDAERLSVKQAIRNLLPAHEHPRSIYFS